MVDVNPQLYKKDAENDRLTDKKEKQITDFVPLALKDSNFLILFFTLACGHLQLISARLFLISTC
jgi:hypothetical protein